MTSAIENIGRGVLGMCFLVLVCYLLSNNKKAINWKLVTTGVFAQLMFAMGVLNTKVFGQPVFWLCAGVIILYNIFNKIIKIRRGEAQGISATAIPIFAVAAWLFIFFFGMIRSTLFNNPGIAILISIILIAFIIKWLSPKYTELIKWGIRLTVVILCISIFTKACDPDIFKTFLSGVSSAFVELLNLSHKEQNFFSEALPTTSRHGHIFLQYRYCLILSFCCPVICIILSGILQKIVYVFAYLLNKMNISGAESLSTAANIFLGQTELR